MNTVVKDFLVDRDQTGREIIFYPETGKKYYVEYIGKGYSDWGDINPATGKIEGSYGHKFKGSVSKEESVITEANGFTNIVENKGSSHEHVNIIHNKWKKENGY